MHTRPFEIDPRYYEGLGEEMDKRNGSGDIYNGSTKIITALMALLNGLALAAICGGVVMYGRVSVLEEKISNLASKIEMVIRGDIKVPHGP